MTVGRSLLVVDGDRETRRALSERLSRLDEFDIHAASSVAEALAVLARQCFDTLLLDSDLPDGDGRELCRFLRGRGVDVPIVMLMRVESNADVILALDAGANDCVAKSINHGVLLARLRAHLRQYAQSGHLELPVQNYRFRPSARLMVESDTNRTIRLTGKETGLLACLYRAGDRAVSRETLLGAVWGYSKAADTHTIETHVYRLRQKIERDPRRPAILLTEGDGYRLAVTMQGECVAQGAVSIRDAGVGVEPEWQPKGGGDALVCLPRRGRLTVA